MSSTPPSWHEIQSRSSIAQTIPGDTVYTSDDVFGEAKNEHANSAGNGTNWWQNCSFPHHLLIYRFYKSNTAIRWWQKRSFPQGKPPKALSKAEGQVCLPRMKKRGQRGCILHAARCPLTGRTHSVMN